MPAMMSEQFHIGFNRRQVEHPAPPSPHFKCPHCPFEGDEMDMIDHAQDCGHIALMMDEGCPND